MPNEITISHGYEENTRYNSPCTACKKKLALQIYTTLGSVPEKMWVVCRVLCWTNLLSPLFFYNVVSVKTLILGHFSSFKKNLGWELFERVRVRAELFERVRERAELRAEQVRVRVRTITDRGPSRRM